MLECFADCVAHDPVQRVPENFDFLSVVNPGSPTKMAVGQFAEFPSAAGCPIQKAQGLAFGNDCARGHLNNIARNTNFVKLFETVV